MFLETGELRDCHYGKWGCEGSDYDEGERNQYWSPDWGRSKEGTHRMYNDGVDWIVRAKTRRRRRYMKKTFKDIGAQSQYVRDVEMEIRGDAAAATWTFRGDGSRRGRGRDVDSPRRRVATRPRPRRG